MSKTTFTKMSASSSEINAFVFISREINLFVGSFLLIFGVIGAVFNAVVLLSLQTFRRNSCAFYLIIMSFVNLGQLLTGLLSRVVINASGVDWTESSLFYCKFRMYFLVVCTTTSMMCLFLATADQYLATCHRPRWQKWSHLKMSIILSFVLIVFSVSTSIPCLIFYEHQYSPASGQSSCVATNPFFLKLNIYFYRLVLSNIIPLLFTLVFGISIYRNIKDMAYRTTPLVRRELDKQLTVMVLVQDAFTFVVLLPISTLGFLSLEPSLTQTPLSNARFQLVNNVAVMFYYLYFASPFYIYLSVSERFRRQFQYALFDIYFRGHRQRQTMNNQIIPQI